MTIFYDFETSTREFLGQILTYSFIVISPDGVIHSECNGRIQPKRMELPDPAAILVSHLSVEDLMHGDTEYVAAHKIHEFLGRQVELYGTVTLVGFNSNQFDLQFLRNLFIRYGLNPYFFGKLHNLDILHFVQHLAFSFPDAFPWIRDDTEDGRSYYSFRLEACANAFGCLDGVQSHDAREDVLLTIRLVKQLEHMFGVRLSDFSPIRGDGDLVKQKVRHFPAPGEALEPYVYKYWLVLSSEPKSRLLLDLEKFDRLEDKSEDALLGCVRYINFNKHFWIVEDVSESEVDFWSPTLSVVTSVPLFKGLTLDAYFEKTKKAWDIEYQIYELGFKHIDHLYTLAKTLIRNPDCYAKTLKELWESRRTPKDLYLIQLYNRVYLNYHPHPEVAHMHRYVVPRYITGDMLRDKAGFVSLESHLASMQHSDNSLLQQLYRHYQDRLTFYSL